MIFVVEAIILISTIFFIGYPLFAKNYLGLEIESDQMDDFHRLLASKDMTLSAIKDLEFDFLTGKLSENDYNELKEQYETDAVEILEKIDRSNKVKKGDRNKSKTLACSKCSTPHKKGDKFCSKCGKKFL